MAKKELGHVELQWKCPNCSGLNPGHERLCIKCGAPQPKDVKFEQAEHQVLITDETIKAQVDAGADIHCPYCGARNPAKTAVCVQCGGDLTTGVRRETGQVVGALNTAPAGVMKCPRCGAENPDTGKACVSCGASLYQAQESQKQATSTPAPRLSPWMIAALVGGLLVLSGICVFAILKLSKTETISGNVQAAQWERTMPIEGFVPVNYNDWQDRIPQGVDVGSCSEKLRSVESQPVPNSVEVCGTPYTVDTGTGYGDVVQDCEYQVYDQFCSYSVNEWKQVDTAVLSGEGFNVAWPSPDLTNGQRLGQNGTETYTILFSADGKTYSYQTADYNQYQQFQVGSTWSLVINSFGNVVSVEK